MSKFPAVMTALRGNLSFLVTLPLFWLSFVLIYQPQMWTDLLNMETTSLSFNATIIMCILLGVVLISRGILLTVHRSLSMSWSKMIQWEL